MRTVRAQVLLLAAAAFALSPAPALGDDSSADTLTLPSWLQWGQLNAVWRAPDTSPALLGISRSDVMKRAEDWVQRQIPYCQCNGAAECCGSCPYCGTYRCDCSGYVSYCWNLGTGYSTSTLPQVATAIAKNELQPGDALLNAGHHVILFGGWADSKNATYHAYQEPGCHNSGPHHAYKAVASYPGSDYKPYRYKHITN